MHFLLKWHMCSMDRFDGYHGETTKRTVIISNWKSFVLPTVIGINKLFDLLWRTLSTQPHVCVMNEASFHIPSSMSDIYHIDLKEFTCGKRQGHLTSPRTWNAWHNRVEWSSQVSLYTALSSTCIPTLSKPPRLIHHPTKIACKLSLQIASHNTT